MYRDPALRELIESALAENPDVAAAAARVMQAQANLDVVRSQFYPALGASYSYSRLQTNGLTLPGPLELPIDLDVRQNVVGISLLQYEVDFWGRIRRATESARAKLLATVEAKRMVEVGLVATVAGTYVALREQDHELEIAKRTKETRVRSLKLISIRQEGGQSSLTEVRQAEVLVAEVDAAISRIERQIAQLENQLSVLAGRVPGAVRRGTAFTGTNLLASVPAGLRSDLLNRRPDIRGAEQALISATAEIGAAEARLLPAFTLTAGAGLKSREFSELLSDPLRVWQIGPAVNVPVFAGGRLRAGVRGSQAVRDEAEATYRKSVLTAMREVSDSLVARTKNAELVAATERVVVARKDASNLIWQRYDNGVSSYLEVLYNDQELFDAELSNARARLDELNAVIQLYRALGGGWERGK
ncbi:MAG: outer membrane protein, multidrug efflux system [Verrucomicrobia bacterium]|nr:MAG: outer membrane protein, multidrug efflux system [Verrucomicrobiota bacterium]